MRNRTPARALTMSELFAVWAVGTLREVFSVYTADVVLSVARIGWRRSRFHGSGVVERVLPPEGGLGYLAHTLRERLVDIQKEHVEWKGWSVLSL